MKIKKSRNKAGFGLEEEFFETGYLKDPFNRISVESNKTLNC
jgi:hypothetical protein